VEKIENKTKKIEEWKRISHNKHDVMPLISHEKVERRFEVGN
jgi:hypothetical protein